MDVLGSSVCVVVWLGLKLGKRFVVVVYWCVMVRMWWIVMSVRGQSRWKNRVGMKKFWDILMV